MGACVLSVLTLKNKSTSVRCCFSGVMKWVMLMQITGRGGAILWRNRDAIGQQLLGHFTSPAGGQTGGKLEVAKKLLHQLMKKDNTEKNKWSDGSGYSYMSLQK